MVFVSSLNHSHRFGLQAGALESGIRRESTTLPLKGLSHGRNKQAKIMTYH